MGFIFIFIDSGEMLFIVLWPQGVCSTVILHFSDPMLGIAITMKCQKDSQFSLGDLSSTEMHLKSQPQD